MTDAQDLPHVPEHFYKYRALATANDFQNLEKLLLGNELYFSSPASFNDPFDCKPAFDFTVTRKELLADYERLTERYGTRLSRKDRREDQRQLLKDPSRNPKSAAFQRTFQDTHDEFMAKVGVYCVSEVNDDILMWAHYADSNKGICLEFDGLGNLMALAQPVKYQQRRPVIRQFRAEERLLAADLTLLTKAEHWKYEKEWRLIRHLKGFGVEPIRPENLTGIIIGAQTPDSVTADLLRLLGKRLQPLPLYKVKVSRTDFKLLIKQHKV